MDLKINNLLNVFVGMLGAFGSMLFARLAWLWMNEGFGLHPFVALPVATSLLMLPIVFAHVRAHEQVTRIKEFLDETLQHAPITRSEIFKRISEDL